MSIATRLIGALAKLPPARTHDVAVERDIEAKMADGVVLLADRWYPARPFGEAPPVVLLRSPYGRRELFIFGRLFAERGYQTVIQSCRGTFGSGGEWAPFRHEAQDGRATLEWLTTQPWFSGTVGTFGPSYLGLTQWSLLRDAPATLRAICPSVTATDFRDAVVYPGGSFALETALTWINQVDHQELGPRRVLQSMASSGRHVRRASRVLPLSATDRSLVGHRVEFFQDWLAHSDPQDPWWDPVDFRANLDVSPPASLVGGWYDVFLPAQLRDYEALVAAGREARFTIGAWTHASPGGMAAAVRDGLEWFDTNLGGKPPARRQPVRLFIMGSRRWVDLPAWPPPADVQRWHLHAGGRLAPEAPSPSAPDRYRFDPADPTPSVGGPSLDAMRAGRKDQRRREQRSDVLTYTSDELAADLTVAGPVTAELHVRSSLEHTDFVVRLCDVSPKGRSTNLSDGIVRLRPPGGDSTDGDSTDGDSTGGGSRRVRISMWPTANTFRAGHRLRLQVSSGAHPLFARNSGTGEALATATALRPADQMVFHDPDHLSAVELPVTTL